MGNYLALDPTAIHVRWFDHHLKGIDNGADRDAPVRIFVMGVDEWRDEQDWPLPDTKFTPYYLRAKGELSTEPPGAEDPETYVYEPADPVPTCGGPTFLPGPFIPTAAPST